jgi:hypothetical protein
MIDQPKFSGDRHGYYKPVSMEVIDVDDTVKSPTIPSPSVRMAKVFFRGAPVRVTLHNVDPVAATTGIPFYDGYEESFNYLELSALRMTREGTDNGTVYIVYYN